MRERKKQNRNRLRDKIDRLAAKRQKTRTKERKPQELLFTIEVLCFIYFFVHQHTFTLIHFA
jgi:hypothetical protein